MMYKGSTLRSEIFTKGEKNVEYEANDRVTTVHHPSLDFVISMITQLNGEERIFFVF